MVLKKNKSENNTLFIDASKECVKITNNNKLTEESIQNILAAYEKRENKQYYTAVVEKDRVVENSYNLSVSSYVEQEELEGEERADYGTKLINMLSKELSKDGKKGFKKARNFLTGQSSLLNKHVKSLRI